MEQILSNQTATASLPVAWLKPIPKDYQIPMWRWVLLPATAFMLKRSGGVWINGTLHLTAIDLSFTQVKAIKTSRTMFETWSIPLTTITDVAHTKGVASETIEIRHPEGVAKLMTARSGNFVVQLQSAIARS